MKNNLPEWHKGKWKECGICGKDTPLKKMKRQRGILVCPDCVDVKN